MSAQINRSLTTVKTELEFLLDSNVITKSLFDHIIGALPDRYTDGAPAKDLNMSSSTPAHAAGPPATAPPSYNNNKEEYAEAIYAYKAQQADDLELRQGDKVIVIEKTSENWWKGKVGSSVGMFPSNYVRLVGAAPAGPPAQQQYVPYQQQPLQPIYAQPIQQQQSSSSMPFPPAEYQQQQQQPVQQQQPQQQQQQQHHGGDVVKKFGKKLGNAAIFGAGASLGSDLINSIF